MEYLDFDVVIRTGSGREYPVAVVKSPAGEAEATMMFPYDELVLENRLKSLEIALLRSGGDRRKLLTHEEQAVQEFGSQLFEALFTGEVRNRYDVALEKAAQQGKGLRIRLRIQSPQLAALPWEYLFDRRSGKYVALSNETPLVRYVELPQTIPPLEVQPPLRVLAMVASPSNLPALNVEQEKLRVQTAIESLPPGTMELTWLKGGTWRDLQREMRRGPWHIFYFIGHGAFDRQADEGLLALENEQGTAHPLKATQLAMLLADHKSLRLVLLNSCEGATASDLDIFSSTAIILIRHGIPAVLAMQYEITDHAAIEFSRSFFEALADGLPVDTAVTEARKSIHLGINNTFEWGTPVLYTRAADGVLFRVTKPPARETSSRDTIGTAPRGEHAPDAIEDDDRAKGSQFPRRGEKGPVSAGGAPGSNVASDTSDAKDDSTRESADARPIRRRPWKLRGAMTALALLVAAYCAYAYCYQRTHVSYYRNWTLRYGVVEGISPLSQSELPGRASALRLTRRGRLGPVVRAELVNGAGNPSRFDRFPAAVEAVDSDGFRIPASRWATRMEYEYPVARKPVLRAYNRVGQLVWKFQFLEMSWGQYEQSDQVYAASPIGGTNATHVKFELDEKGYMRFLRPCDSQGNIKFGGELSFGQEQVFVEGLLRELKILGSGENEVKETRRFTYDVHGNLETIAYLDANGEPISKNGCSKLRIEYDEADKPVKHFYYGIDGAMLRGEQWDFSPEGELIKLTNLDRSGNPCAYDGSVAVLFEYDEKGNTKQLFVDQHGTPTPNDDGIGGVVSKFVESDNEWMLNYIDANEQPIWHPDGYRGVKLRYDATGSLTEQTQFGFYVKEHGFAAIRYFYKDGKEVRRSYLDANAKEVEPPPKAKQESAEGAAKDLELHKKPTRSKKLRDEAESGKIPRGFTCADGLRIVRVITYRQITDNKQSENGKFEPEVAKISGDGSTIAFYSRQSGLYTVNVDGSKRKLVWEKTAKEDPTRTIDWDRFELSRDGKIIYWQMHPPTWVDPVQTIFRVNSDGTDERILVRKGAGTHPFRLRQHGQRIFYSQPSGIFSIDTEGKGDFQEVITPKRLEELAKMPDGIGTDNFDVPFDVSEDGERIVFSMRDPREKKQQLYAIRSDGTDFHWIVKTEFEPKWLTIAPNGQQVVFWNCGGLVSWPAKPYAVDWDGKNFRELPLPVSNYNARPYLNHFSADGTWFAYDGGAPGGGLQITRLDGTGRYEPVNVGRFDALDQAHFGGLNLERSLFHRAQTPHSAADRRRFCFINWHSSSARVLPAQLVVGDVNPPQAAWLPVLSEIEFPTALSSDPRLPNHRGRLKLRVTAAKSPIQRVHYLLAPNCQRSAQGDWVAEQGWLALGGNNVLNDDGKYGDQAAKDGIYTTDEFGPNPQAKPAPGRYLLRILAHDERNAVAVDVDGVEIK